MLEKLQYPAPADNAPDSNQCPMSICSVGYGYSWSLLSHVGSAQVPLDGHLLFHKMRIEPLSCIIEVRIKDFVWKSIICCYDLSRGLIIDSSVVLDSVIFAENIE